jgi:hypothetical protein
LASSLALKGQGWAVYTSASIVKTLVAVFNPHHGKVYAPCVVALNPLLFPVVCGIDALYDWGAGLHVLIAACSGDAPLGAIAYPPIANTSSFLPMSSFRSNP